MTALRLLRYVAFAEATTFLALLVAAYFKHDGQGATGVWPSPPAATSS